MVALSLRYFFLVLIGLCAVVAGFFVWGLVERKEAPRSAQDLQALRLRARAMFSDIAARNQLRLEWIEGDVREVICWLPVQPGLAHEIWMSLVYEEELLLSRRDGPPLCIDRYKPTWFEDFEKAAQRMIMDAKPSY